MSHTFTLKGNTSEISQNIYPPVILNPKESHCVGLIGFYTFNSIPNIEEGNNKFYCNKKFITLPTGSYEIEDIEKYIQNKLFEKFAIQTNSLDFEKENLLSLKPNLNTLKCEIKSKFNIDFSKSDSIGKLLGFSPKKLDANKLHTSDLPVNIIKVESVRIECNIVIGSVYEGKYSHTLYEFHPSSNPGYAINIEPRNILYMPINTHIIDNITCKLIDQEGRLINFRGENIIIRMELKQYS